MDAMVKWNGERTSQRVSKRQARILPAAGSSASWHDPPYGHYSHPMTVNHARGNLGLSAEYVASINVGYRGGSRRWRTGDATADAFATEMWRSRSASGYALVLKERTSAKVQGHLRRWRDAQ